MCDTTANDAVCPQRQGCWNFAGSHIPRLLEDCEKMLDYAADKAIELPPESIRAIAVAREAFARGKWTPDIEKDLYAAKTSIAKAIQPCSLETLASGTISDAKKIARFYSRLTLWLVIFIVPVSMLCFTGSDLSVKGKSLIDQNDKNALLIHDQLQDYRIAIIKAKAVQGASAPAASASAEKTRTGAAPSLKNGDLIRIASGSTQASDAAAAPAPASDSWEITDLGLSQTPAARLLKETLQDFSRNNRQLYAETLWLIRLTGHGSDNVYGSPWMLSGPTQRENLELLLPILLEPTDAGTQISIPPKAIGPEDAVDDGMRKLAVYQDIRAMAQNAERTSDIFWGAVTSYLLPVLYAVLGALAYILRESAAQISSRTFDPANARYSNRTRLIIALIVGSVIGLFGSVWKTQVGSASPLAVAFLAGYAADAFFSFLDKAAPTRTKTATI
jgi:hypothetical protein